MIIARKICKQFGQGETLVKAVDEMTFTIKDSELCVIVGPSGAGKTTLLNLLGGMTSLTSGELIVNGKDISHLTNKELTDYRRNVVGFVFQFYNLMPNLTAKENIELATELKKNALDPYETLVKVGLKDRANNFPAQLSGGEQQRVSIARALAKNPDLILCDEPTGALDYVTGKEILSLLSKTSREEKKTVIIVTHNSAITRMADHLLRVKNGRIIEDIYNNNIEPIENIEW